jgi:hypothetical protein
VDSTVMSMDANIQGVVHPLLFNPDGTQFPDSAAANETSRCNPETAPTCGNFTVHLAPPAQTLGPFDLCAHQPLAPHWLGSVARSPASPRTPVGLLTMLGRK